MKRETWKAALLPAVLAVVAVARPAAADDALSLRRVLLSSGGVGYFEYEAEVHGNVDLPLTVPLDQVDDVLKSVVVYDTRGSVGEITLPAKDASDRAFRDLPFDASALTSEPSLLGALQGAEVKVTTAEGTTIDGRVLSITEETTQLPDQGGTIVQHRLALATNGDVRSVILEDAIDVAFVDPTLRAQIQDALAAQLTDKERGSRTFVVHSEGDGDRAVRVGYVVAVPLWKSTYRLTLPADPTAKKAALQGWAVVENQSGADWKDVDLTLVSGNPVTFTQALYDSYYVQRPDIPVEVVGRVLPRLDSGAVSIMAPAPAPAPLEGHEAAAGAPSLAGFNEGTFARAPAALPAPITPPLARMAPAQSTEEPTQVVFHLPSPVSVGDGQEALLPVIDRDIPVERVSLYQPDVDARHPIASVELTNDGETGLPPGVMTTYERGADGVVTYMGDARLDTLPAGDKRFASFGVDLKVTIDSDEHDDRIFDSAKIDGGVLELTRMEQQETDYTIEGAAHEPRTVVLEHPRVPGFEPDAATAALVTETTDTAYRIRVEVPAGGTKHVPVVLQRPVTEQVVIANLSAANFSQYTGAASTELPPALRDELTRVAALRQAADDKEAAVKDLEAQIAGITTDQARVRDDLKAVPVGSDLAKRYLEMMAQQEDKIAALQTQLDAAQKAAKDAEKAVSDDIRSLHM